MNSSTMFLLVAVAAAFVAIVSGARYARRHGR